MNNKGFTLMELLIVVFICLILGSFVFRCGCSMQSVEEPKIITQQQEKQNEELRPEGGSVEVPDEVEDAFSGKRL